MNTHDLSDPAKSLLLQIRMGEFGFNPLECLAVIAATGAINDDEKRAVARILADHIPPFAQALEIIKKHKEEHDHGHTDDTDEKNPFAGNN